MVSARRKKICVISGNRAESGLLRPILSRLSMHPRLTYRLVLTGSHDHRLYGRTAREVDKEFHVDKRVPWPYHADSPRATLAQISRAIPRFSSIFDHLQPDMVLVLGDRSDILPVALAAGVLGIPVAQLHGGDVSGAFLDNAFRSAIAAFASLHLPASREGAERLLARGIPRHSVEIVGATGLDAIRKAPRMSPAGVRTALGLPPRKPYLIVLQHPVLGQERLARIQIRKTLAAVRSVNLPALLLYPNADPGSKIVIREIERAHRFPRFFIRKNLEHDLFVNALRHAAILVGNSSSGIIEAPFLGTPAINIGSRQDGRQRGGFVVDVPHEAGTIRRAILRTARGLKRPRRRSPYGNGHAAEKTLFAIERFLGKQGLGARG